MRSMFFVAVLATIATTALAAEPVQDIRNANITGGLVVQVGSGDLGLRTLGDNFHVRLLLADAQAVEQAQAAIDRAGLQGRFTAAAWAGGRLPFARRVVDALVVARDGLVSGEEARRVIVPTGLYITPAGASRMPVPDTVDPDWTHYLYDAAGNAVSSDQEVGSPKAFRWWAEPRFTRSHNYGNSLNNLVTAKGRLFYLLDDGTYLFDKGGTTPQWSLYARNAFNGTLLWKRSLHGYGQPYFEDVSGQPVPDFIWRTPLPLNRRMVVQGDRVYAALNYRHGPLSVLDAATGETVHEVDVGGIVSEIVAEGDLVICRVRTEIPMPAEYRTNEQAWAARQKLIDEGIPANEVRGELDRRLMEQIMKQKSERVVAVDAAEGRILWEHEAPIVATQGLAMDEGKVVFHNYQALITLDATSGETAWAYDNPVVNSRIGLRNLLGNLLIAEGKVLWTSRATGGGVVLDLNDGSEMWTEGQLQTTGGFGFPTGRRVIDGVIYSDSLRDWATYRLADGSSAPVPDIGGMLKRGHHIRCFAGKATERFLILPHRGTEFVDLKGDQHMVNDWVRGACSYGLMPANGMVYVTPDPCSCYAGARLTGLMGLAARLPESLDEALPATAPERLLKGPAYGRAARPENREGDPSAWPMYMHNARRTSFASTTLQPRMQVAWTRNIEGNLTQATIADGRLYGVRKDTYELFCLGAQGGETLWKRAFPAALDGPPTIVGDRLFIGCRNGDVYSLGAADGELAWRYQAAPLRRLTVSNDSIESLWPVSSSVLFHEGLIYAVAGRISFLDGGVRLVALDPATGRSVHHAVLEGPWPDKETLSQPVVDGGQIWKMEDSEERSNLIEVVNEQYATGYHIPGGQVDLLVTDGAGLYMAQNKFDTRLNHIPLQRQWHTGYTPMGGMHMLANFGLLDDTMFHRTSRMFDDAWPAYGSGPGSAARGGSFVVVGEEKAYSAQHYEGGGYATHRPGSGNRIVADTLDAGNQPGDMIDQETASRLRVWRGQKAYVRTDASLWTVETPIIIRSMILAPDGQGGELVFTAGIVEGETREEWNKSTAYMGPGKLQVHSGADGRLLAEYDLPACPVYDGMSAARGRLLVPMINGEIICLQSPE